MTNEFETVNSTPSLPPITLKNISKEAIAEEFADAIRRGYTEADLRKQVMDTVSQAMELAKTFL